MRRFFWVNIFFMLFLSSGLIFAQSGDRNPPMEGFNMSGSDARAIEIADEVMAAMGGRANWDNTRYVTWRFFGRRLHVWDKWTGNVRVESERRNNLVVLMNINTREGQAWENGEKVHPDSLKKRLEFGYRAWINDSYWVFMPYKLKDSGVTLTYKGDSKMEDGRPADILELTFENVGVTPQNKYQVFVAKDTRLVEQWAFYREASNAEPGFTNPWANWKKYGNIMLSDERGRSKHSDIAVFKKLPPSVFESPEPVDMMSMTK